MITYSQMNHTDKYSQHSSIIWPVWLRGGIHTQGATLNVNTTLGEETPTPVLNIKSWQEVL